MIETITSTLNGNPITTLPVYMIYTVTYADGATISSNQELLAGEKETYRVRVEYSQDIDPDELPADTVTYDLTFGMDYLQKTGYAVPIRTVVYNVNDAMTRIGYDLPDITVYDNYQDALDEFGKPFLLKHVLSGDKVIATYVGFAFGQTVRFIQGGVIEEGNTHPIYEANKLIMNEAFGEENCYEWTRNSTYSNYHCSSTTAGVSGYAATDGYICSSLIGDTDCTCFVHVGGHAACNDD